SLVYAAACESSFTSSAVGAGGGGGGGTGIVATGAGGGASTTGAGCAAFSFFFCATELLWHAAKSITNMATPPPHPIRLHFKGLRVTIRSFVVSLHIKGSGAFAVRGLRRARRDPELLFQCSPIKGVVTRSRS